MRTIKINGVDYKIKYTIRALFIFEQITGKSFKIENLLDNYIFFYSMILANNPDNLLDWDDFLNCIDENPYLFEEMNNIVTEEDKKNKVFNNKEGETKESKKV